MNTFYTKQQIDSLASIIGNKIASNSLQTVENIDSLILSLEEGLEIVSEPPTEVPDPVEPEVTYSPRGLKQDYSGTGWYYATDTNTVFCKDVPSLQTTQFEEYGVEYVSVYNRGDAQFYNSRAAVSNLTTISYMFSNVETNPDVSTWDVSNVTTAYSVFHNNFKFNQDISNWDVSNIIAMESMFSNATSFNQDLSGWCVSKIPEAPMSFDNGTTNWVFPKPVWGTCPGNEA